MEQGEAEEQTEFELVGQHRGLSFQSRYEWSIRLAGVKEWKRRGRQEYLSRWAGMSNDAGRLLRTGRRPVSLLRPLCIAPCRVCM